MSERHASRTALLVAAYRARASAREKPLISDPWAAALAGEDGEAIAKKVDGFMRERELWIAVRTAFIDEEVVRWTARHPRTQVVILGAGLDTRAARFAKPGVRFFEVDQPASQRDKRERLARIDGYPRDAATHVECDFEKDDFLERLVASGFEADAPALVLWEGVTPYLHEAAIRATLHRVAHGCHPQTMLLFDHFTRSFVERQSKNEVDAKAHDLVDALGERFVFGTNDPLPMLYEEGFRHVRSVSFDEITLSFTGTYDRERAFRFQRIVLASRTKS
jgi:methyltransferase (TIGR00027 family)